MIALKNVTKLYQQVVAVEDLSLTVEDGEIMGIIGHNGAGKSTALKMILGLVAPTAGEIRVLGRDMVRDGASVKRFIGYLPEESPLYETMTVTEYLMFFAALYGLPKRDAAARIDVLLDSLKLPERERFTGELSKGMKRKVTIARTLLHDPRLLILDEPNSGLDPLTSFFIINYLKHLRHQGKTILLSAHNLFHIEYICDRVAILKNGRLVVCDRMESIRESLGHREFQVIFRAYEDLAYEQQEGNYVFRTSEITKIAQMLETISEHDWALVNLSVRESALEDIYVALMTADV
ncbi:MAG TPA: ABC transporter ATP-binding protein [Chloroflexi bacterium]|nr:ABC transporter ATP-binding protein [Chloroflexota bacterium]